jgi:hypothetical protein
MLPFNADAVFMNARTATTEDLLNRVTVYRNQIEPEALAIFEAELRGRGVSAAEVLDHGDKVREGVIVRPDGTVPTCSFCRAPAVAEGWGWHRLFGRLPVFPRRLRWCREHREKC